MTNTALLAVAAGSLSALALGAWLFLHSERFGALPEGEELDALPDAAVQRRGLRAAGLGLVVVLLGLIPVYRAAGSSVCPA